MQAHQERVIVERAELAVKCQALASFISGEVFPTLSQSEQKRLRRQLQCMSEYEQVLLERIAAFDIEALERGEILDAILVILAEAGVPTPEQTYKQAGGFSLALADIKRALAERPSLPAHQQLMEALAQANDICRSMHAIVERRGAETSWDAFLVRLNAALNQQHKLLHPSA